MIYFDTDPDLVEDSDDGLLIHYISYDSDTTRSVLVENCSTPSVEI